MKFLIDAQLPRRLALQLAALGHDVVHTLDLPLANRTPDQAILEVAAREARIVVTKDRDFVDSFTLRGEPAKLLLISTGNISNRDLEMLFVQHFTHIESALAAHQFVELSASQFTVHL